MQNKFDATFELKFLAETGVFEGYASVFNVVDQVHDKTAPGAFKDSLAAYNKSGRLPPLLWQHEALEPIGAHQATDEIKNGTAARRLNMMMRQAAADACKHKEKQS
jgi:HK97 family phage prohead protease